MVHWTLSKNPVTKNWAGGVAQGKGPDFKPQYHTQKKFLTSTPPIRS
jgi:hypothetical protein